MTEVSTINLAEELAKPFPSYDIEWRVQRASNGNGGPKAVVIPYVTNRAIMSRLDKIFGPGNWKNEYIPWGQKGVLCGISVKVDGEWVTKYDGAEETNIEPVKGGLSGSMKRAAVQWGIGRYLYSLDEAWVNITNQRTKTSNYINDKKAGVQGYWEPPQLPSWAVSQEVQFPPQRPEQVQQPTAGNPVQQFQNQQNQNRQPQQQPQQGQSGPLNADPVNTKKIKELCVDIANLELGTNATPEAVNNVIRRLCSKYGVTKTIDDVTALQVVVHLDNERKAILAGGPFGA